MTKSLKGRKTWQEQEQEQEQEEGMGHRPGHQTEMFMGRQLPHQTRKERGQGETGEDESESVDDVFFLVVGSWKDRKRG